MLPTFRRAAHSATYDATVSGVAGSGHTACTSHHAQKSLQSLAYPRIVFSALLWRTYSRTASGNGREVSGLPAPSPRTSTTAPLSGVMRPPVDRQRTHSPP